MEEKTIIKHPFFCPTLESLLRPFQTNQFSNDHEWLISKYPLCVPIQIYHVLRHLWLYIYMLFYYSPEYSNLSIYNFQDSNYLLCQYGL